MRVPSGMSKKYNDNVRMQLNSYYTTFHNCKQINKQINKMNRHYNKTIYTI